MGNNVTGPARTDLCAGHHKGAETSAEAFASTPKEKRESQRSKILWLAKSRPQGMTCEEAETILGITHQTCSARIAELAAAGSIKFSVLVTRKTRSGKSARVYFST